MSDDQEFSAFINSISDLGRTFHISAIEYRDSMPIAGFVRSDAGGAAINEMLGTTLRMVAELHLMIAQAMDIHGAKLTEVSENYSNIEEATTHNANTVLQEILNAVHHPIYPPASFPHS